MPPVETEDTNLTTNQPENIQPEPTEDDSAGFAAGFNRAKGLEVDRPVEEPAPEVTPEPSPEPEPTPPAPTLFFGLEESEVQARLNRVSELEQNLRRVTDDLNGRYGRLKQVVEALQQATPQGDAVEISVEDLAALKGDYPELASVLAQDLNAALKKVGTRGTGQPLPQGYSREELDELFNQRFQQELGGIRAEFNDRLAMSVMDIQHPDRMEIQASPEFNAWLKTKPAEYQQEVETTWDINVVGKCLSDYKAHQTEQAKNRKRVEGAVQPTKGGRTAPPSVPNPSASFEAGFRKARN